MLFIFMGPSCTGKSTLALELKKNNDIQIYTGKEYLHLARNENEAWNIFYDKLAEASDSKELSSKSAIYVITEKSFIPKLQSLENAVFVKFTADLDIIKERFAKRTNGKLPIPLEKMLEKQVKDWEEINSDLSIDTTSAEPIDLVKKITDLFPN